MVSLDIRLNDNILNLKQLATCVFHIAAFYFQKKVVHGLYRIVGKS